MFAGGREGTHGRKRKYIISTHIYLTIFFLLDTKLSSEYSVMNSAWSLASWSPYCIEDRTRFQRRQEEMGFKQCDAKCGPVMAASAPPGSLAEMQIPRRSLRPTASESLPVRPWNLCTNTLFTWFLCTLKCENYWSRAHVDGSALLGRKKRMGKDSEVLRCGEMRQGRLHQMLTFYWSRSEVTCWAYTTCFWSLCSYISHCVPT